MVPALPIYYTQETVVWCVEGKLGLLSNIFFFQWHKFIYNNNNKVLFLEINTYNYLPF